MPISPSFGSSVLLELDGKSAGLLHNAQPPSLQVELAASPAGGRRSTRVVLGELAATASVAEPGPLVDWLKAALGGTPGPRDGAFLVADANYKLVRRIAFRGIRPTGLTWSVIDATQSKEPWTVGLRWQADSCDDQRGSDVQVTHVINTKRKPLMRSNFRISGLPFDASGVTRIALPDVSFQWATGQRTGALQAGRHYGALAITCSTRSAPDVRAWVRKQLSDGVVDENDAMALQIDLLDPTLKQALASVQIKGCLLAGVDEPALDDTHEIAAAITLRFNVTDLSFALLV